MVKTVKTKDEKQLNIQRTSLASACIDCLFWYRCHGGKLDCLIRAPLAQADGIRA